MKMSSWQKTVAVLTLLAPASTAFAPPSLASSTATPQKIQTSALEKASLQNEGGYQLAQGSDNCHQVTARNGLYVREEPTVYSRAIGVIPYGRNVTVVENSGANTVGGNRGAKWMPISAPLQGYVYAGFLSSCQESPAPNNCREVALRGTTRVQAEPSINSPIKGVLTYLQRVTLVNRGENGWVPISDPIPGYISSAALRYCS